MSQAYIAELSGCELIECVVEDSGQHSVKAIASLETLQLLRDLKKTSSKVSEWREPSGNSASEILVRELIQKVRGEWKFPIDDPELCHCRAISANKVDQAIVAGAHRLEKIRRLTSANTACGTCFPEIEKLLKFRLK